MSQQTSTITNVIDSSVTMEHTVTDGGALADRRQVHVLTKTITPDGASYSRTTYIGSATDGHPGIVMLRFDSAPNWHHYSDPTRHGADFGVAWVARSLRGQMV